MNREFLLCKIGIFSIITSWKFLSILGKFLCKLKKNRDFFFSIYGVTVKLLHVGHLTDIEKTCIKNYHCQFYYGYTSLFHFRQVANFTLLHRIWNKNNFPTYIYNLIIILNYFFYSYRHRSWLMINCKMILSDSDNGIRMYERDRTWLQSNVKLRWTSRGLGHASRPHVYINIHFIHLRFNNYMYILV